MIIYKRLIQLVCGVAIYLLLIYSSYLYAESHSVTLSKQHMLTNYPAVLM
jgi:hypothetical protein